jgi:hypothetical protein
MRHTRVEKAQNESESGWAVSLSATVIGPPGRWADLAGRAVGLRERVHQLRMVPHSLLFRKS